MFRAIWQSIVLTIIVNGVLRLFTRQRYNRRRFF
jgi:hypothetical protein